jgi:hypothetical protein
MTHPGLVCAACARPVAEGRCPMCRRARRSLPPTPEAAAVMLLAILIVLLAVLAGPARLVG